MRFAALMAASLLAPVLHLGAQTAGTDAPAPAASATPEAKPTATPPLPPAAANAAAYALHHPDESSPFFLDQSRATAYETHEGAPRVQPDAVGVYPLNRGSEQSASAILKKTLSGVFGSVHIGPIRMVPSNVELKIDPSDFSLQDRREITANFRVKNTTSRLLRLSFPTTQRFEIITRDSAGKVIDRWSDDHAFDQTEGMVTINPGERIQYSAQIPTRDMQGGKSYTIEASVAGHPKLSCSAQVVPRP